MPLTPERRNALYSFDTIAKLIEDLLSQNSTDRMHALFLVDHDGLRHVNDALGSEAGDAVIEHTAQTLPDLFRATDLVARTAEDEFIVLMKDVSSLDAIESQAGLVQSMLRCTCKDPQAEEDGDSPEKGMEVQVSIGIALSHGKRPGAFTDLYAHAYEALLEAKCARSRRFVIFDSEGQKAHPPYGFNRLVADFTPNLKPFLESIEDGGVLLRSQKGKGFIPLHFSDSFLELLGSLSREEAFAIYGEGYLKGVHPDDVDRLNTEYADAYEREVPLRTVLRLRGADGAYVWVSLTLRWVRGEEGHIDAYASHASIASAVGAQAAEWWETGSACQFSRADLVLSRILPDGPLEVFDREGRLIGRYASVEETMERLSHHGFIHHTSLDALRGLLNSMETDDSGSALLLANEPFDQTYRWMSFTFKRLFDEDGTPLRMAGAAHELPRAASSEGRLRRAYRLREMVRSRVYWTGVADLFDGTFTEVDEGQNVSVGDSYDRFVSAIATSCKFADDTTQIETIFTAAKLLEAAREGRMQVVATVRRVSDGTIRWVRLMVHLAENPVNGHVMAFLYAVDVERLRNGMLFAMESVRPERATGLFSKNALERIVSIMQHSDASENPRCGLAVISTVSTMQLRSLFFAEDATRGHTVLGQQLSVCLAHDCLVARHRADSFLLFCPHIESTEWFAERIAEAVSSLKEVYEDQEGNPFPLQFTCGYATSQLSSLRFNDLVAQAESACSLDESLPDVGVRSFEEQVESFRSFGTAEGGQAVRILDERELSRPLFGDEQETLDAIMRALLFADDYHAAIDEALRILGTFYNANRVFTVSLLEGSTISGLHEWNRADTRPAMRQIVGSPLKDFSVLSRALSARAAVSVVRRPYSNASEAGAIRVGRNWRFTAFPIWLDGGFSGFLCVEDAHAHIGEVALLHAVVPLLARARERQGVGYGGLLASGRDVLTGLPDDTQFQQELRSYDPNRHHSTGVLRIGLREARHSDGTPDPAGDERLTLLVARNLCGMFPTEAVYRTGEREFACVCTNLSFESFQARCSRMLDVLRERAWPGFALCDSWSDKMLPLAKLFDEASTTVFGDRSILFPEVLPTPARMGEGAFDRSLYSIRLQPQVDLTTGKVVAAEALARCSGLDGSTISPAEFVPRLEAEGEVAKLDYFVLEQALSTITAWKEQGIVPVPIAVNFSRQTVSDASFVASVLAICSCYDVPEGFVEIEITESIGAVKTETLRNSMHVLRGEGFRFALDDLGSEYSTLSAMSDLPFDVVKIDRLLVSNILNDPVSKAVVEGVAQACDKNGLTCIAEGVESDTFIDPLMESGCKFGQGYCLGRPMTVDRFTNDVLSGGGSFTRSSMSVDLLGRRKPTNAVDVPTKLGPGR